MEYVSIAQAAQQWEISERSARNYCAMGRVPGAKLKGKTWRVPKNTKKPERKKKSGQAPKDLLQRLKSEKDKCKKGGVYEMVQEDLTYNSSAIDDRGLCKLQTKRIFGTNVICAKDKELNLDDVMETVNHFRCVDTIICQAKHKLSENFIKELHAALKAGTLDSRDPQYTVGDYRKVSVQSEEDEMAAPDEIPWMMRTLLDKYENGKTKTIEDIVEFHYFFETLKPFQDGNGRIGRLIMFKECLRNGINPFIIETQIKDRYFKGLAEWADERETLIDACLICQEKFEKSLKKLESAGKK